MAAERSIADEALRGPVREYPIDREAGYTACMAAGNLAYWEAVAARRKLLGLERGADPTASDILSHVNSILVILDPRYWRQLSNRERDQVSADARKIGEFYAKAEEELAAERKAESDARKDVEYDLTPAEAKAVLKYAMRHKALFVSYDPDLMTDGDLKIAANMALRLMKDVTPQQAADWVKSLDERNKGEA